MAKRHSKSFKLNAVEKLLQRPDGVSVEHCAQQLGVGYSTLQRWLQQTRNGELSSVTVINNDPSQEKRPGDWTTEERAQAVLDCHGLDEHATSRYCRERGIFIHHVAQWKDELMAKAKTETIDTKLRSEIRTLKDENKALKRELARKEKALAETAALITLRKKAAAIWGMEDEDA